MGMPDAAARLTAALKEAKAPQAMIDRAEAGYYGDFTSPLATPITQLVMDALKAGLKGIAERAKEGEFDGD
jgi:hypothetical protein